MQLKLMAFSLFVVMAVALPSKATARPRHFGIFNESYRTYYAKTATALKCTVCHSDDSKRENNQYSKLLLEELGAKNVQDPAVIQQALKAVEPKPSAVPGLTYGDLIRAGRLPNEGE